jgi:DNA-binding SARP family transcriptional activator/pimeloyl-ACP methyl ester carboxylesterase
MDQDIELKLLGSMSVTVDGNPLKLPASKKTRALLAYLVVRGQPEQREHLCELFWDLPDDPRASLRWSLSKLRRLVDTGDRKRLIADRTSAHIELPEDAVDFSRLRKIARHGVDKADTKSLLQVSEQAGTFLEGVDLSGCEAFNTWCIAQRETTRQWRIEVLNELTTRPLPAEVIIGCARDWTMLDPYSAVAWERLVTQLEACDRAQEAVQQRSLAVRVLTEAEVPVPATLRRPDARKSQVNSTSEPEQSLAQKVRFCTSRDGTRIAYTSGDATSRSGTTPLVRAGYWMHQLERDPESPVWRPWIDHFSAERQLVRYDLRGLGLSDRHVDQSLDRWVEDLSAVVDSTELDQFDLHGTAQGAVIAITYAARHPERVRRLVLQSGYALGWMRRNEPREIESRKAIITLATSSWQQNNQALLSMFLGLYIPDGNDIQRSWFSQFLLAMMTARGTRDLQETLGQIDIRDLARTVTAPALVLHPRGEMIIPYQAGRELATLIPDARLLTLDSASHVLIPEDPCWGAMLTSVDDFLS